MIFTSAIARSSSGSSVLQLCPLCSSLFVSHHLLLHSFGNQDNIHPESTIGKKNTIPLTVRHTPFLSLSLRLRPHGLSLLPPHPLLPPISPPPSSLSLSPPPHPSSRPSPLPLSLTLCVYLSLCVLSLSHSASLPLFLTALQSQVIYTRCPNMEH